MQNSLFENGHKPTVEPIEVINQQGLLLAWPDILAVDTADALFNELLNNAPWQQESIQVYGKVVKQPRLTCWYGAAGVSASSGYTQAKYSDDFTPSLLALKQRIEALTDHSYNSVLLNLYRDGQDSVAYHADDEAILGKHPAIASFSLGAQRQFMLRHQYNKYLQKTINLQHNSLILMAGAFQENWLHGISKTQQVQSPRINLTFRQLHI